jgi:ribosomal protein S14
MANKTVKKPAPKPKAKAKAKAKARPKAKAKPKDRLECRVCGYRVIVDEACGCVEEHVLLCCGQPMVKK